MVSPIRHQVAAISCGVVEDTPCLDLCYQEDSRAQVDMNFVMNDEGNFIEMQGTGEGRAFTPEELQTLMAYGRKGIEALMQAQRDALGERAAHIAPKPILVAATGNEHKLNELRQIFGDMYSIVSMGAAGFYDNIEENATTFAGNAAIKAEAVCKATGLPTIADDSGLTVEALDGEPGVYSARYAGVHGDDEANNNLLLRRMKASLSVPAPSSAPLRWPVPARRRLLRRAPALVSCWTRLVVTAALVMIRCSCTRTARPLRK